MKNPNGFGSVFKIKDKNRRKPWRAVITMGKDLSTGKIKRHSLGYFASKQEAFEALVKYNQNPHLIDTKNITFLSVVEKWKVEHYPKITERRIININSRLNKMAVLNDMIFTKIKLIDLQSYFNNLNIASGSKKEYKAVLNMIFDYAVKYDIVDKNPVQFIDTGKHQKVRQASIFNQEEISILWKHQLMKNVDTILILIYTGLRINELLELKKENVFIEDRYIIAGSKTEAGKDRLIPLHKDLIPMIKRRYKESKEYLIEQNEKKISYHKYLNIFSKLLQDLNIDTHRIHDTRHTFATIINDSGANSTSIKNIIGHSDFRMTEKVYTHKNKIELIKAIDMINLKQG